MILSKSLQLLDHALVEAARDHCQTQNSMTQLAMPIIAATAIEKVAAQRRKRGAPARLAILQPRAMAQTAAPPSNRAAKDNKTKCEASARNMVTVIALSPRNTPQPRWNKALREMMKAWTRLAAKAARGKPQT